MNYETVTKTLSGIDEGFKSFAANTGKEIDAITLKQREHSDEIFQMKQRKGAPGPELSGGEKSIGAQVWDSMAANADLLGKTKSLRLQVKAAADVITTANVRTVAAGGISIPIGASLGIQNGLPTRPLAGFSSFEYSRYTGVQGAAGIQAGEGTGKPAIRPDFATIQQGAITIAGFTKLSKQSLSDSSELKGAIDITLRRSIATALDDCLMDGSFSPAFDGFNTLGTAYTSLVYTSLADAASEAVAVMQQAGFQPNVVAFRPSDFLGIQLAKASTGEYLAGPYLQPLPELLRGLRVVLSPNVPSGKVIVADTAHLEMLIVDDLVIEIGYVNEDFTNNVATILGEIRIIPTFRAAGSIRVITPKTV